MTDNDRPQDVGRSHSRKRKGGAADQALVTRYYASMRSWLTMLLDTLEGEPQPDGLHGPVPRKMPSTTEAGRLWDLATKLARELGAELIAGPDDAPPPAPARTAPRARRADYG